MRQQENSFRYLSSAHPTKQCYHKSDTIPANTANAAHCSKGNTENSSESKLS